MRFLVQARKVYTRLASLFACAIAGSAVLVDREDMLAFDAVVQKVAVLVGFGDGFGFGVYQQGGFLFVFWTGVVFEPVEIHAVSSLFVFSRCAYSFDGLMLAVLKFASQTNCSLLGNIFIFRGSSTFTMHMCEKY